MAKKVKAAKGSKKWWKWIVAAVVAVAVVGGLAGWWSSEEAPEVEQRVQTPEAEQQVPEECPQTVRATDDTIVSVVGEAVDQFGQLSYKAVHLEEDTVVINVAMDGLVEELYYAVASGDSSQWSAVVDGINSATTSAKQMVDRVGREDLHVCWNVLNDQNLDNVLLSSLDGVTAYDAVQSGDI